MKSLRLFVFGLLCLGILLLAACTAPVGPEPSTSEEGGSDTPRVLAAHNEPAATLPARLALAFVTPTPTATVKPALGPSPTAPPAGEAAADDPSNDKSAKKNGPAPTPIPQYQFLLPPIDPGRLTGFAIPPQNRVRVGKAPRIALTFDTGAGSPVVRMILAELKQAKVPATFFIVGNWAEKNGDIVRQIAADGHDLGNHSYNHPNFTTLSDEQIIAQLVTTDDIIERETGCTSRPFVRAPYGALNPNVLRVMAQAGFESIFWSAHGGDWLPGMTTESVRQTVDKLAGNGGIIVLHSSVPETAQAVPQIVQDLRARGLEFVRLSELLAPDPAHPYRAPCKPKL